jgi:ATP-dependent Lon protease
MSKQRPLYLSQFSDLMGSLPGFNDELTSIAYQRLDADGSISCPFLPLRDVVIFPQMVMPLFVGRQRSLAAIQAALHNRENIVVSAQRSSEVVDPAAEDLYTIGTEVTIGRTLRMPDDSTSVLGQGQRRVEIVEFMQWDPYIRVKIRPIYESDDWLPQTEPLMRAVLALFEKLVDLNHNLPEDAYAFALNIDEPGWLSDFVAATLSLSLAERQEILEIFDPTTRLQKVSLALAKELEVLQLEDQIQSQVQEEVERSHREHFLREQMRVIQGELGETDIFAQELDELAKAVEQKELPAEARAKVDRELSRLRAMPPMSPEIGIIRTYVDWIVGLPWSELSTDNLDVAHAAEVLDGDHYALDKVKDRILEYIAVRQIAPDSLRSPILCFVGPPGTGKTSIGRSIANALGREFVRMSLGGVRDEAEIRGHRRTYIGALPGRVIQSMRRVGTCNPLFMLDEIDKLGNDFRGDPASALLEVLDPEQNNTFTDHYLELEFDLSQVLFITTANFLDTIPPALQDRLEVIRFSGYLEEEKLEICNQFLVPRQLEEHGLAKRGFAFETAALQTIIRHYTLEAGVRNLEREIANVCRKLARTVAEKKRVTKKITAEQVEKLLGPPKFTGEILAEQDEVGVATGAAWTAAGGDIMFIEVNLMPGKGNLLLTGQLGDVMRESGQAALSFIRSQSEALAIDPERFEKTDIHIHLPEGAVPKDGPSAGVTLVTALASAFTNRPVRRDVAMTGEVTLRGRVLAVGGIREKALAARRAGVKTFIMPRKNESDLQTIPEKLRQDLAFVLVERADEVLAVALTGEP